ncbi:general secretion pathway protein GspL [Acinetobacter sp. NCu2D-2]|uniref:type II secretion system protein GspL n=1 Tax=Acinetobacter sp. NCu2D-2 TaxID=1608473 RepID=UPI0007CDEEB6|nr:type II secretion system protein GspL [Acinetobacter sp. NCu2D-2]ANF81543.1 general secretion pathway protein GspL [Acinetobacter sp. NCu2D-2]
MLYLWMPEANGVWQWTDGEFWNTAISQEQLIQDTQNYHGQDVVVFFSSRHAQILELSIPKPQYKKMGVEGVKYLLEEYVILPIDAMKILHQFSGQDQLSILGIAHSTVETMQHSLNLLPFKVAALLPDFLVLPEPELGQTILAQVNDRLIARDSAYRGDAIDDLTLYLDYQDADQRYLISNLNVTDFEHLEAKVTTDQIESNQYHFSGLKKAKQHPFNVLPKVKSEQAVSGCWKACAAVFVALLLVQFTYDAARWYQNKKVANVTAAEAIDQFKYWFGQSYPVTEQNIKSQFEGQLRQSQTADTQLFSLISRIGPVLLQNQIVAQQVTYADAALNMQLKAKSSESLNVLVKQLSSQGFKVELGNIQAIGVEAVGLVKIQ